MLSPRAARQRAEVPRLLGGDLEAELLGRAPHRLGIELVARLRPDDQEEARPALEGEELRQGVGHHRAARRDVEDIGAAIGAAQPVVGRSDVEDRDIAVLEGVGHGHEVVRRKVGDDVAVAAIGELAGRVDGALALVEHGLVECVALAREGPRRGIVGDGEARPGHRLVRRHRVDLVEGGRRRLDGQHTDADLDRRRLVGGPRDTRRAKDVRSDKSKHRHREEDGSAESHGGAAAL